MNPEITIVGFPKCGTSALMRRFENDSDMRVLRTSEGALEVAWTLIRDIRPAPEPGRILVHKWTAYVYRRKAIEYLVEINPRSLLVLCVRDPARALVSWHNMHRNIARSGRNTSHFAWKERDFYGEAALPDYYERYARQRLQYDRHLGTLLEVVPRERLVVVSQERMAEDIDAVALYLKALARGEATCAQVARPGSVPKHKGYADKADIVLDKAMLKELAGVQGRLQTLVVEKVLHKCI